MQHEAALVRCQSGQFGIWKEYMSRLEFGHIGYCPMAAFGYFGVRISAY